MDLLFTKYVILQLNRRAIRKIIIKDYCKNYSFLLTSKKLSANQIILKGKEK